MQCCLRPHLVDGIDCQVGHWVLVADHLHIVEHLLPWLHTHPRAKCGVDDLQAVNAVHLTPYHLWQAGQLVLSRGHSKREAGVRQAHGSCELSLPSNMHRRHQTSVSCRPAAFSPCRPAALVHCSPCCPLMLAIVPQRASQNPVLCRPCPPCGTQTASPGSCGPPRCHWGARHRAMGQSQH